MRKTLSAFAFGALTLLGLTACGSDFTGPPPSAPSATFHSCLDGSKMFYTTATGEWWINEGPKSTDVVRGAAMKNECLGRKADPYAGQPEEDDPAFDCATMRNKVCGPTSAVPASPVAATEHTVEIRVQALTSDPGVVFRVKGEVFGDTGPTNMPAGGKDSATFQTTKSADQLDITVTIAGKMSPSCGIYYDGKPISKATQIGTVTTCTVKGV